MKSKIIINSFSIFFGIATLSLLNSCQTDTVDNGLVNKTTLDASFTITPVAGEINTFVLEGSKNVIASKWYFNKGAKATIGKTTEKVSFPDVGVYNIKHTAIGIGGEEQESTQTITITIPDPIGGNLINGGQFRDTKDFSKWTRLVYFDSSGNPVQNARWAFNPETPQGPGSATIIASKWEQQGIYQIINVVANQDYKIEMVISGEESATNTWFEVYVDPTPPAITKSGDDYSAGGAKLKLTTWCGGLAGKFAGDLSVLDCDTQKDPKRLVKGIINFKKSGPVYFVIRSGGEKGGASGITIQDVQVRGLAPLPVK
jgi:hypothetical protein